ncbi:MAG: glutamine-hydrolyzing carbamoyl-phosphate synthase small subunit [Actinomycetota bacterium]
MSDALLVLEDGVAFPGRSLGAEGEAFGEVVFNTGMSGYQEVLTDPSYARQIVVMTYPHQGNYGVNDQDPESGAVQAAGFVVREASRRPSSWRSQASLAEYLTGSGVVGIEDLDTRALTLHIREAGAMRAAISTRDLDPASLVARVQGEPGMLGADLATTVSTRDPYEARELVGPAMPRHGRIFRVAALDWGLKRNSLRLLHRRGCDTVVFPALTPPRDVLAEGYDGVFLSNGPGDPAATTYAVEAARAFLGHVPVFGICLGHQVVGRALGGRTYKLKFGHRGANQPVVDLETGRVDVTSHNHGFAVDPHGWASSAGAAAFTTPGSFPLPKREGRAASEEIAAPHVSPLGPGGRRAAARAGEVAPAVVKAAAPREAPVVDSGFGRVMLTHWNLNDGTLEGLRCLDVPAFSVQYHPEAAPGPHDAAPLFDRFVELMEG